MGKFFDLLQAAAGESSLAGAIGRWRQAISEQADTAIASSAQIAALSSQVAALSTELAALSALASELDILGTKRSGLDQVGVAIDTDVVLNNLIFKRGAVSYDSNTGVYTLVPLRVYELDAGGAVANFSSAAGGFLEIAWVNAVTNAPIPTNVSGIYKPSTQVNPSSNGGRTHTVFIPTGDGDAQVKLRVLDATGIADISTFFGCVVKQLR